MDWFKGNMASGEDIPTNSIIKHEKKGSISTFNIAGIQHSSNIPSMAMTQVPKKEVSTICKAFVGAYAREYPHKMWPYAVQYLHCMILKFSLINSLRNIDVFYISFTYHD